MTLLLPLLGATIPTTRNPAAELASLSKRDGCSLPTLGTEDIPDDPNGALCKPQGEGDWTFAMVVEETPGLPVAPGADNDFTNTQSSNAFYIFDVSDLLGWARRLIVSTNKVMIEHLYA